MTRIRVDVEAVIDLDDYVDEFIDMLSSWLCSDKDRLRKRANSAIRALCQPPKARLADIGYAPHYIEEALAAAASKLEGRERKIIEKIRELI